MPTAYSSLTLCTTEDVYLRASRSGLEYMAEADGDADRDSAVQQQINLTTDYIRQRLIKLFKDSYPSTVDAWFQFAEQKLSEARSRIAQLARSRGESELNSDILAEFTGTTLNAPSVSKPMVYLNWDVPGDTTLVNVASNGDIVIDYKNWAVYQNIGTSESPSWEAWNPEGFIDLIANPTELTRACVTGTLVALCEKGSFADNGDFTDNLTKFEATKKRLAKQFEDELTLALSILHVDFSKDGTISDFEKSGINTTDEFGFA